MECACGGAGLQITRFIVEHCAHVMLLQRFRNTADAARFFIADLDSFSRMFVLNQA